MRNLWRQVCCSALAAAVVGNVGLAVTTAQAQKTAPAVFGIVTGAANDEFVVLTGAYFPGKGWRSPEVARHVAAKGMRFDRFSPSGIMGGPVITSEKPTLGEASEWGMPLVKSASAALPLREDNAPPLFALSGGPKTPQPRRAKPESTEAAVYRSAVAGVLKEKGRISVASPHLTQNLRVDLNGDGTEEVLLVANSTIPVEESLPPGGYTAVVLRYLSADGKVRTAPLGVSTSRIADKYNLRRAVLACVDIDGDGRLEIVTYATQYESEVVEVWTFDGRTVHRVTEAAWGV